LRKEEIAVEAKNLTKQYGYFYGLRDASFRVYSGEIFGLFGPNGAGKTTLIRLIATLTRPTKGEVHVFGLDVTNEAEKIKEVIGILTDRSLLYDDLTGRENLEFYLKMYGFSGKDEIKRKIGETTHLLKVEDRLDDTVRTLSSGLRRRFDIARAIIHSPKLVLLDEPFSGLDIDSVDILKNFLVKRKGELTVIVSTHNFEVAREICDRIAFLKDGKIAEIVNAENYSQVKVEKYFA